MAKNNIAAAAAYIMTVAEAANRQQDAETYYLLRAYAGLLAEGLKKQAASEGARVWVVEWTAELMPRDVARPGETIKHLVPGKPWPRAQQGATVEVDGLHYVVAVNATTKKSGHECQFGIYVLEPCTGYLVRIGAGHGFDAGASDDTVV
jgi:hypothetical protein